MITVVIPMAGEGRRFAEAGFDLPKPFIGVNGRMMIELVLEGANIPDARYVIIARQNHIEEHRDAFVRLSANFQLKYATVKGTTQGACCTALVARKLIDPKEPVVFVDSDNVFLNGCLSSFVRDAIGRGLNASLLTFPSSEDCFSYAEIDDGGNLLRTREKEVVSDHAIAGAYFFQRYSDFMDSAIEMLIYGDKVKNEYYMSNVYNHALLLGLKIGIFDIPKSDFVCLGTPNQLNDYLRRVNHA